MTDQWQELKETIVELRDNDGTSTQQEVCKFLANYMDILEKQMQEQSGDGVSKQAVFDIVDSYSESQSNVADVTQDIISDIMALPPANLQKPKTGHWIDIMVGDMPAQACDQCNTFYSLAYTGGGHKYCPNCGAKMQEVEE